MDNHVTDPYKPPQYHMLFVCFLATIMIFSIAVTPAFDAAPEAAAG